MKRILVIIIVVVALMATIPAMGQASDQGSKSDQVLMKLRQIDLLNMLIPLALTHDQIEKILPAIERARQRVRQAEKDEAATLLKLDGKVTEAIKKSIETSVAPPKELLDELAHTTQAMGDTRDSIALDNTESVLKVFVDTINAGQKKAAINSFSPAFIDPKAKPDTITDDVKLHFFVNNILLDPQAYDILVQMSRHAS
ncbi:MAG TPA: hypothetical protein VMI31_11235 [Fimbriimonadaceae bacterium]|nr:hypothetical protein [Fimbriimonadaceae bacterium]